MALLALCDRFGVANVAPSLVGSVALRWLLDAEVAYRAPGLREAG